MADENKKIILEVDINTDDAIKATAEMKKRVSELQVETKKLKETQGETSEEYIKSNAELKAAQDELRQTENLTKKLTAAQKNNAGTVQRLEAENAKLRKEQKTLNLTTADGVKRNEEINQKLNENMKFIKQNSDLQKQQALNVGNYNDKFSETSDMLTAYVPAAGKAAQAARLLGKAFSAALGPIGIIIALIGAAVAAVKTFFASSEEGQNKLAKLSAVSHTVFNNIRDEVAEAGKTIVWAFDNPKEAVKNLWEVIKSQISNRLKGFVEQFKALGTILKGVFSLDWDEVKKGSADFAEGFSKSITGVDHAFDKMKAKAKEMADEMEREIAIAKRLADQQAALDLAVRKNLVDEAKIRGEIDELRAKASDKDNYNARQRIEFLDQAIKKENEIMAVNKKIALQKYNIKHEQNQLSKSTKEDLDEEAKLLAEVYNVESENARKRKELLSQRSSFTKEAQAEDKAAFDEFSKMLDDDTKNTSDFIAKDIEEAKRSLAKSSAELDKEIAGNYEQGLKNQADALKLDYENKQQLAQDNYFAMIDLQKQELIEKWQNEVQFAEQIGADVAMVNEKYRRAELALEREKVNTRLQIYSQFTGSIAELFGEQTRIGKIAASAQTLINTYLGAQAAFAQTPGGIIIKSTAAGLATAIGLKNVAEIWKVKSGLPGDGGGGSSTSAAPVTMAGSVGQGIVSRDTSSSTSSQLSSLSSTIENQKASTVLVVDKVTAAQNKGKTSSDVGTI